jgi:hypothetical protein
MEESTAGREYFTTFKVIVHGERIKVVVMCDGLEWVSDFVPVGDKAYDENLAFTLDETAAGPRSCELTQVWVSNCVPHHKLCGQQT